MQAGMYPRSPGRAAWRDRLRAVRLSSVTRALLSAGLVLALVIGLARAFDAGDVRSWAALGLAAVALAAVAGVGLPILRQGLAERTGGRGENTGAALALFPVLITAALMLATGGVQPMLLPVLLIAPFEAVGSGSRRLVGIAAGASLVAVCVPLAMSPGVSPAAGLSAVWAVLLGLAALHATALALDLARTMDASRRAEARLRDREHLLAVMGHEIRTPVNAIVGFAHLIALGSETGVEAERRRAYAKLIRTAGEHLDDLSANLLDGLQDDARETGGCIDGRRLVHECCDMMQLKAEFCGIELRRETEVATAALPAEGRAVRQVLLNLISNAIKFTPRGGCVRVRLGSEGGRTLLVVADTGIGMDGNDLPDLGAAVPHPAPRARPGGGLGLGLPIVAGLVRDLGGDLTVETAPGRGTTVTIAFAGESGRVPGRLSSGPAGSPASVPAAQAAGTFIPQPMVQRRA